MGVLANADIKNIEIIMAGNVAAGGSNSRFFNFVFHFNRGVTSPTFSKTQAETAFQAAIAVPVMAALNLASVQINNSIRNIDDALDPPLPVTRALPGLVTGDRMDTTAAAYINLRSNLRGKNFRGSKHFFPLSESDTTLGSADVMNAGSYALWQTVAAAILAGFTDAGGSIWTPINLSRILSQLKKNPTNVVFAAVTQCLVNKRIGTMTHRKVKSIY